MVRIEKPRLCLALRTNAKGPPPRASITILLSVARLRCASLLLRSARVAMWLFVIAKRPGLAPSIVTSVRLLPANGITAVESVVGVVIARLEVSTSNVSSVW